MMLAEIDLTQLNVRNLAVGVLGILGFLLLLPALLKGGGTALSSLLPALKGLTDKSSGRQGWLRDSTVKQDRSSDQAPPEGFQEHLQLLMDVSPNASPATQLAYALAGMTEAQVARTEARLAKHPPENEGATK